MSTSYPVYSNGQDGSWYPRQEQHFVVNQAHLPPQQDAPLAHQHQLVAPATNVPFNSGERTYQYQDTPASSDPQWAAGNSVWHLAEIPAREEQRNQPVHYNDPREWLNLFYPPEPVQLSPLAEPDAYPIYPQQSFPAPSRNWNSNMTAGEYENLPQQLAYQQYPPNTAPAPLYYPPAAQYYPQPLQPEPWPPLLTSADASAASSLPAVAPPVLPPPLPVQQINPITKVHQPPVYIASNTQSRPSSSSSIYNFNQPPLQPQARPLGKTAPAPRVSTPNSSRPSSGLLSQAILPHQSSPSRAPSVPSPSSSDPSSFETSTTSNTGSGNSNRHPVLELALKRDSFLNEVSPLPFNPPRSGSSASNSSTKRSSKGKRITPPPSNATASQLLVVNGSCWTCGNEIAHLNMRGYQWSLMEGKPKIELSCLDCLEVDDFWEGAEPETKASGTRKAKDGADGEDQSNRHDALSYEDTISAAVDRLKGLDISHEKEPEPTPSLPPPKSLGKVPNALTCDVCSRQVGSGRVSFPLPPSQRFTMEVVCIGCFTKYKACTDCGGGGGRLTPGRWRSKELFPEGRKTCQLSHVRTPAVSERTFRVYSLHDLSADKVEKIVAACRVLFFNARLGTLARPEMLERGDGLVKSFREAERTTVDAWSLLSPCVTEDIEAARGIRRYFGIQYALPRPRTKAAANDPVNQEPQPIGFLFVEHELSTGAVFFPAVAPWATTGPSYDANTALGVEVLGRLRNDLGETNKLRLAQGLPPFPRIACMFVAHVFKSDSKVTHSLERRGYRPMEEVVAEGKVDRTWFPPYRKTFIPEAFAQAWKTHVRLLTSDEDMGLPPSAASKPSRRK